MKILGIETSSQAGGAALMLDDKIVGEAFENGDATHTRRLLPSINSLLRDEGWKAAELDLIAVSIGPGSFTGLRIGMSVAKGLAAASGAAIVGVPTLEALASLVAKAGMGYPIRPVTDARKSEVFTASFDAAGARLSEDINIKPAELVELLADAGKIIIAGDGVIRYKEIFEKLGGNAIGPAPEFDFTRPSSIAESGRKIFLGGVRHNVETIAPVYVRGPDAVIHMPEKSG